MSKEAEALFGALAAAHELKNGHKPSAKCRTVEQRDKYGLPVRTAILEKLKTRNMTAKELAVEISKSINYVRSTISEMKKAGNIEIVGHLKVDQHGRQAVVYGRVAP